MERERERDRERERERERDREREREEQIERGPGIIFIEISSKSSPVKAQNS